MMAIDIAALTLAEAGAAFRSGQFSPLQLTETYLHRIEHIDGELNSFITVTADAALAAAQQATDELAAGTDRGALHGIPLAYKDLIATAGVRTTSASRIHAQRIPDADATVVRALTSAGAVSLGKLNMLECAYGVVHPDFGPALNPWSLEHSSSGSSSGSAVAVAAGLCLAALGTDTGGSIRIPAAWCGIVGHKPTYGLVSRHGVDALAWSLDHVGPMTRTVQDAALLLEGMAGFDPLDPGSAPASHFRAADLDAVEVQRVRVGVPRELLDIGVDGEVRRIVERALEQLGRCVGSIDTVDRLPSSEDLLATEFVILFAEAAAIHQPWLRTRAADYAPLTRDRLEAGSAIPAIHYIDAQRKRRVLLEQFARLHERFDVLALPAAPTPAMRLTDTSLSIDGEAADVFHSLIRLTGPFNVTGAPAVSVPCGWTSGALPVGLQLTGRHFEDHVVLATARAFEAAHGEAVRLPPFALSPPAQVRA
jgi:aspartyl-tRNA(Asn)/glutamyl-tRNA(Gln) amidotransferase subunit A